MIRRLHLSDWRVIAHYLGTLLMLSVLGMLIPFVLALVLGEYSTAADFLMTIGITATVGGLLMLFKVERGGLDWRQALIITGLCWVVLSIFGALPLWLSGHCNSYLDAYFDSVSAYTTTGLRLAVDIDHMAVSLTAWCCVMHVLGGIGVVVIALALGIFGTGNAACSMFYAEARSGQVMPQIKQTARFFLQLLGIVLIVGTLVCFVPLLVSGESLGSALLDAVLVTSASFSTGGMSAYSMGIMHYHSWVLECITLVLAALGCVNFALYGEILRGRTKSFFKDIEIKTLAIWISVLVLLMALAMASSYFSTSGSAIRRGLFEVLSASFNLGYSTIYPGQLLYAMGSGALFVIVLTMTIGGSASSMSGGIKAFRIGIIARSIVHIVREALAPDRARPRTFYYQRGRHAVTPELVSSAMVITLLFIATYAVGAVAGIVCGYDALSSVFESVAVASNTGLSTGITAAGMPFVLKVVYILEMWLGRLEFIAIFAMFVEVFAFFTPQNRTRRKKKNS